MVPYLRLNAALEVSDWSLARELITALPETLDGFSTEGAGRPPQWVPLSTAAYVGAVEFVAWLPSRGAAPDGRIDERDQTPLWGASSQARGSWTVDEPRVGKFFRVLRLPVDAGADPHADCGGSSTPDAACRGRHGVGLLEALAEFERRYGQS